MLIRKVDIQRVVSLLFPATVTPGSDNKEVQEGVGDAALMSARWSMEMQDAQDVEVYTTPPLHRRSTSQKREFKENNTLANLTLKSRPHHASETLGRKVDDNHHSIAQVQPTLNVTKTPCSSLDPRSAASIETTGSTLTKDEKGKSSSTLPKETLKSERVRDEILQPSIPGFISSTGAERKIIAHAADSSAAASGVPAVANLPTEKLHCLLERASPINMDTCFMHVQHHRILATLGAFMSILTTLGAW
eukprot:CAMPEP_0184490582 /NCGR_PEP_ID=MMETSP0113_2-20130426/18254_1 /TAXON_ID=91329 /ORGANISM="Norrisiella sphaerica, Strain BC52" /LENGTH=247 /DNA_ID=CAMNT_0026874527 /DNA_START=1264 /DNA_END=2004 /DNA_ORIENTATION=-